MIKNAVVIMKKKALITGITGQDGSYLAELLLGKGYEVHGLIRRASTFNTQRIDHIYQDPHKPEVRFFTYYGDLTDTGNVDKLVSLVKPDEIYHLGAQSHVRVSFDMPEYTCNVGALGTLRILEAIKNSGLLIKFYNASSSEQFGASPPPQNEKTPFQPMSPYAVAKVFAHQIACLYREAYGIFACNGVLFNHESPRRGETFVTRKITRGLSRIKLGIETELYLGNLEAKRDWGYSKEYVECMWRMLQQPEPDDYVIATGETHSVREFVEEAAQHLGFDLVWQGEGLDEKGIDRRTNKTIIEIDPSYFRPTEVEVLVGDASKAREKLGWEPKIKFKELVKIMADASYNNERKNLKR